MVMNRIKKYKEENFGSWLEFVLTFGVCKFEDGGFLLTVYGWGGILAIGGAVAHLLADYAAIKVAEATKEMYPLAYVEWLTEPRNIAFLWSKSIPMRIDELFEYWKQNIRK